jgi:hypothetical protein
VIACGIGARHQDAVPDARAVTDLAAGLEHGVAVDLDLAAACARREMTVSPLSRSASSTPRA